MFFSCVKSCEECRSEPWWTENSCHGCEGPDPCLSCDLEFTRENCGCCGTLAHKVSIGFDAELAFMLGTPAELSDCRSDERLAEASSSNFPD